jgi:hypothetical protein
MLGIASAAFLRPQSHGTHHHSLLSRVLRHPQPGGQGSWIYFPQEEVSPAQPGHWAKTTELEVILRPTVSRQVRFGVGSPLSGE